jgi:hypothetical protein
MKHVLISLTVSLLLAGCGTTGQIKPIETKSTYKSVPKQLTTRCPYPELPQTKDYLALTRDEREALLMDLIKKQIKVTKKCNDQFQGIEDWDAGQKKVIEGQ